MSEFEAMAAELEWRKREMRELAVRYEELQAVEAARVKDFEADRQRIADLLARRAELYGINRRLESARKERADAFDACHAYLHQTIIEMSDELETGEDFSCQVCGQGFRDGEERDDLSTVPPSAEVTT